MEVCVVTAIRDVTKEARRALRSKRTGCPHQHDDRCWREKGRGKNVFVECTLCGTRFPCADNECEHFDCAEIQIENGARIDFPDHATVTITDKAGRIVYDNMFDE
jgi:hypothetical protein